MFNVTKRLKFEAAHQIPGHDGPCANLHGHTYYVDVELQGVGLDDNGFLLDFGHIKHAADGILPDHKYLNEVYQFVPSAENLAMQFYRDFKRYFPGMLKSVTVHEGPNNSAKYSEA